MRSTRTLVCLVAFSAASAGLLSAFCSSVNSQETKKANPRIKELQQKRLAILEQVYDSAKQGFATARTSYEDVYAAEAALLAARLEYAETQKERIKACDAAIEGARKWQDLVHEMVASGRASRITEMKAEAYLLETQITREKIGAVE